MVSGGELKKALVAGIPGERIVFSGVGKTKEEMRLALEAGIYQFNVEGEPELEALNEVASSLGIRAPVTIRLNPDIDAKTARENHHRNGRDEVRNSVVARPRRLCACR